MTTVTDQIKLLRTASSLSKAKDMRAAVETLGASHILLRACGMWLDEKGEDVNLTETRVPVRDVKSVWVEANVNDEWVKVRPNTDPHLEGANVARIEVEAVFDG